MHPEIADYERAVLSAIHSQDMAAAAVPPAAPFDITPADIGRYVRRRSTTVVGRVKRDDTGWLYPKGIIYEWERHRADLEYVTVTPDPPPPTAIPMATPMAALPVLPWPRQNDTLLDYVARLTDAERELVEQIAGMVVNKAQLAAPTPPRPNRRTGHAPAASKPPASVVDSYLAPPEPGRRAPVKGPTMTEAMDAPMHFITAEGDYWYVWEGQRLYVAREIAREILANNPKATKSEYARLVDLEAAAPPRAVNSRG